MGERIERDSFGAVSVPQDALYGAQTERALRNFRFSTWRMPSEFVRALGLVKAAAATVNRDLGLLPQSVAAAVIGAAERVAAGELDAHFPVDVFQTGSGTSTHMNANEVIARCASLAAGVAVHPNDHVNMSQSSNDVIPTAIHVAASLQIDRALLPALEGLAETIERVAEAADGIVKTGRTHLMDAMPIRAGQEASGWAAQVRLGAERVRSVLPRLHALAIGGTAVGTGVDAPPDFGSRVAAELRARTGIGFVPSANLFEALSAQDAAVETSGQLKTVAVSLVKIANDLRWMNSGPLAGLGEIELPALQPGSSMMPGKVNPVIPEAVAMACVQVIGNDAAITLAGQSGSFQLNVMLPLVAHDLLLSIGLLANAARALGDQAIAGMKYDEARMRERLLENPVLITALNRLIGYEAGAAIARRAYAERRPILDVALEQLDVPREELERLLDPAALTHPGMPGA